MKKYIPLLLAWLVSTTAICISIVYVMTPPTPVVFDLSGTLNRYQDSLIAKNILGEAQEKQLTRFDLAMREVVQEFAIEHNVTIWVSAAEVAGAQDVTAEIQSLIIQKFKTEK